ncbi:hypothetical protein [Pseudalkalibacillus sp. R45]|uniref:hypothetical protein n=1 Tax=Pseudalkalibacillus sp. R45 TaxID=3457433 RepID=UPI003FCE2B91
MNHARLGARLLAKLYLDDHFRSYVFLELSRRNPLRTERASFPAFGAPSNNMY